MKGNNIKRIIESVINEFVDNIDNNDEIVIGGIDLGLQSPLEDYNIKE